MLAKDASIRYEVNDEKSEITLFIGDTPVTFNTEELQNLIGFLAHARTAMQPAVPVDLPDGMDTAPLSALLFRHISEENDPLKNGAVVVARSPLFGWQSFQADPEFCQGLIAWLSGNHKTISTPPGATLN
jgi:hypothetical protein